MNKNVKVLVISHNPFSGKQNNGKTLTSFFMGWEKENIRQIFLTMDEYDTTVCENFYRISDVEVLKSMFKKNKNIGTIINCDNKNVHFNEKKKYDKNFFYQFIKKMFQKKIPIFWLMRSIAWKFVKPWKSEKLIKWINEFNPDVIFFQTSSFSVIYDMVIYFKKITQAKLIIETTDDYVTSTRSFSIIKKHKDKIMEKKYANIVKESEYIVVIGEDMMEEYKRRFGGKYVIAMNAVKATGRIDEITLNDKFVFTFAGNLGLNRWKILVDLGKVIDIIQSKYRQKKIVLNICSLSLPNKHILSKFKQIKSINYLGALNTEQLNKLKEDSNVLVHVESFDKKNIGVTRLSISTKIPEYMLSNRCILAIGPDTVSSIKYIKKYNIGCVLSNKNSKTWMDDLINLIDDDDARNNYIKNARTIGNRNHNYLENQKKVQEIICSCVSKNKMEELK